MTTRFAAIAMLAVLSAIPSAQARLWKPTPVQLAQDYTILTHIKPDGRVVIQWIASTGVTTPAMQQLLDKFIVLSIARTHPTPGGVMAWDDVVGVTVSDGRGTALKEVADDALQPTLVGMISQIKAVSRQQSGGASKVKLMVFEAGSLNDCAKGQLQVAYDGETYTFDTPIPGCTKP